MTFVPVFQGKQCRPSCLALHIYHLWICIFIKHNLTLSSPFTLVLFSGPFRVLYTDLWIKYLNKTYSYSSNSADSDKTDHVGATWSGSTLFANVTINIIQVHYKQACSVEGCNKMANVTRKGPLVDKQSVDPYLLFYLVVGISVTSPILTCKNSPHNFESLRFDFIIKS